MKFLVDCCAGRRLAEWLRNEGHDVFDAGALKHDPGDATLPAQAAAEDRVLITLDNDFGELLFVGRAPHAGVVRLPDLPVDQRIILTAEVIRDHREALQRQALITIRGSRVRITYPRVS